MTTVYGVAIIKQRSDLMLKRHPDECKHMEIGKDNVGENKYFMTPSNVLKTIYSHEKQNILWITFDSTLKCEEHISQMVNKQLK